MTTQLQRPTAKIYAFPSRPRTASGNANVPAQQQAAANFPSVEFGGGWYHDVAIEQDDEARDLSHQQH
jgi:hypothetical protein